MNAPLGVSEMVRGVPVFTEDRDRMTSVIAYVYKNHSLAFVGTKSGKLKKVGSGCSHSGYWEASLPPLGWILPHAPFLPAPGGRGMQVGAKEYVAVEIMDHDLVPSLPLYDGCYGNHTGRV